MILENPLFIIPVLTGLIFIIAGFIQYKFPPKKINNLYGYRTARSMRNQASWEFAQLYSSKLLMKLGVLLALSGFIGLIYKPNETLGSVLGLGLMILVVIVLVMKVEKRLKELHPS